MKYTWRDANRVNWAVVLRPLDTTGEDWTWSYEVIREHDTLPTVAHSGVVDGQYDHPPSLPNILVLWQIEVTSACLSSADARREVEP